MWTPSRQEKRDARWATVSCKNKPSSAIIILIAPCYRCRQILLMTLMTAQDTADNDLRIFLSSREFSHACGAKGGRAFSASGLSIIFPYDLTRNRCVIGSRHGGGTLSEVSRLFSALVHEDNARAKLFTIPENPGQAPLMPRLCEDNAVKTLKPSPLCRSPVV